MAPAHHINTCVTWDCGRAVASKLTSQLTDHVLNTDLSSQNIQPKMLQYGKTAIMILSTLLIQCSLVYTNMKLALHTRIVEKCSRILMYKYNNILQYSTFSTCSLLSLFRQYVTAKVTYFYWFPLIDITDAAVRQISFFSIINIFITIPFSTAFLYFFLCRLFSNHISWGEGGAIYTLIYMTYFSCTCSLFKCQNKNATTITNCQWHLICYSRLPLLTPELTTDGFEPCCLHLVRQHN